MRIAAFGLTVLVGLLASQLVADMRLFGRPLPAPIEMLDRLAAVAGFGVRQVEISGHHFTSDRAIHDTLDLPNVRSLIGFDSRAARQRIERLPWVATATVTRVFPDRLSIAVTERKASARWQRGERMHLIDASGRVLSAISAKAADHLPLVVGEGAAEPAATLFGALADHPDLLSRLESAERIEGRRWSLSMGDGLTVLLPPDDEKAALTRLAADGVVAGLAAMSAATVDVRQDGRMIVRRAAPQAGAKPSAPALAREVERAQRG